jgi:His/Glu/Gln/Arg/opine family amino acid ABC transporter permease subunit
MGPLLTGLWTTLWMSAISSVLGLIIGLIAGLMKISKNYTVRTLAAIYVEVIRGTPLLVQIFIAYFFFGTVFNLDRNVAGIGALALFAGAYVAEIIRSGIQSIAQRADGGSPVAGHEHAPGDDGRHSAPGLQTDSAAAVWAVHQPDQGLVPGFGYCHHRPDQIGSGDHHLDLCHL